MIRGLLYLLYFLVILLVVRMIGRWVVLILGAGSQVRHRRERGGTGSRAVEDLVRDPVCKTYVPRSRALSAVIEGRPEHFCSEECRDRARTGAARAS